MSDMIMMDEVADDDDDDMMSRFCEIISLDKKVTEVISVLLKKTYMIMKCI